MSTAWIELSLPEEDEIWAAFQQNLGFQSKAFPETGINEPIPSVTYSVTTLLSLRGDSFLVEARDINSKALMAFRNCVEEGEFLYALDWQHPCYRFYPHAAPKADDGEKWRVDVFPCGDYYIFLAEDLSFGTFGHPWKETVCVFGEQLIHEFEKKLPDTFKEIRRK